MPSVTHVHAFMGAGVHGEELCMMGARGPHQPNPNLLPACHGADLLMHIPHQPPPVHAAPTITPLIRLPALC